VDEAGIFIVKNGIVGNNTSRKLDVDEFRGFVLIDKYAPFIFVNGCDFEGAQMFTIAHELAHIWTGQSAVFNLLNLLPFDDANEEFCNKIAAEFLVPGKEFTAEWEEARRTKDRFKTLSPHFKVSQLVIARRALDLGFIDKTAFFAFYKNYRDEIEEKVKKKKEKKKGKNEQEGDFYNNQNVRVGKRFAAAVFQATQEGRLLYRDAFRLTGLYGPVFDRYKSKIGL